jgi:hypothetical protein
MLYHALTEQENETSPLKFLTGASGAPRDATEERLDFTAHRVRDSNALGGC